MGACTVSSIFCFKNICKILIGCAVFALGFDVFLLPNGLNAGGISGLSMVLVTITKFGTIGIFAGILNFPLFAVAGIKIGRRFFALSLFGMLLSSAFIDVFALLPAPETDSLVASLYGGVLCGIGVGIVYTSGGSTGGADIIVRLIKLKCRDLPIGLVATIFDLGVAAFTGLFYADINRMLYSGIAIIISGRVIDAVVYRFDYSRVALIVSREYEKIAEEISMKLGRGATFLYAEGSYLHCETKVVLTAVRRQQLAELKRVVAEIDPDAFVIVQETHQVLGDGFSAYTKDSL